MAYQIEEIEVKPENPYAHDLLDRKPIVDFLSGLIERLHGPFVLSLDSPFGTGKTTLVKMLMEDLKKKEFHCIYFNAWEVDYVTDPLVALVSFFDDIDLENGDTGDACREKFESVKKFANHIVKRGAVIGTKVVTAGFVDIDKELKQYNSEFSDDEDNISGIDIVDAFTKQRGLMKEFRFGLEDAIKNLPTANGSHNLVIFIDELDRCRPTFALELLERVKHFFNIPNIIFVLSIDKAQLETSIKSIYGDGTQSAEYLQRFIHLEYGIPPTSSADCTEALITRFELDSIFKERSENREAQYDKELFVEFFTAIADIFELTMRARERCLTRLCVVLDQTPSNHYLDPTIVALLTVLRTKNMDLYQKLVNGEKSPDDVMEILTSQPLKDKLLSDRQKHMLHAYLILMDLSEGRTTVKIKRLKERFDGEGDSYSGDLLQMIVDIKRSSRAIPSLTQAADKIDLASGVR
ncbi:MAG: P-loop NTPase fold protein [Gammaproteobacteria bacterium]|nr:P-loop NTPase fold protein [Gammaproteobacteria bacterium]